MRKILALGCCALYLAFGVVAGMAHVHESADHHEESRGLHLDHDHAHEAASDQTLRIAAATVQHHGGDAFYLNATATQSVDPGSRETPAIVSDGSALGPPALVPDRVESGSGPPRDPPCKTPPRLRGPPV